MAISKQFSPINKTSLLKSAVSEYYKAASSVTAVSPKDSQITITHVFDLMKKKGISAAQLNKRGFKDDVILVKMLLLPG